MSRIQIAFGILVLAQAAHSVEEYVGRLWESFPPARFVSGLVANDREIGFIVINLFIIAFGIWCFLWPLRRQWQSASALVWLWVTVETINGIVHPLWSLYQRGYTPGVATAPVLFVVAFYLLRHLLHRSHQNQLFPRLKSVSAPNRDSDLRSQSSSFHIDQ